MGLFVISHHSDIVSCISNFSYKIALYFSLSMYTLHENPKRRE